MKTDYVLVVALLLTVQLNSGIAVAAHENTRREDKQPAVLRSAITNDDVSTLLKNGLSAEIIIAKINASACDFNTSTTALQQLKAGGVPDAVILAMVQAPKGMPPLASMEPSQTLRPQLAQPEQKDQPLNRACMAVKPIGSHAFRNIVLFGAAGALISHEQYQVVDVMNYPSHVGQKYHGNDLQTIESSGTRIAILPKHYTAEDLHKACR